MELVLAFGVICLLCMAWFDFISQRKKLTSIGKTGKRARDASINYIGRWKRTGGRFRLIEIRRNSMEEVKERYLHNIVSQMVSEEADALGQWRLGQLIAKLEGLPPTAHVYFEDGTYPSYFCSYRGYYEHLSIGKRESVSPVSVETFLDMARDCMGKVFEGYKGGEFKMGNSTLIFIANYGNTGERLVGVELSKDSKIVTLQGMRDEEWE